jgi:GntR family transcriptional regulator
LRGDIFLDILISNSSGKPIYEQIEIQIKNLIITGELRQGQMLPSIRLLAKELCISVITTKRAYEELEHDGFIETVAGKGSFVAKKNVEFIREEHLRRIEESLQKAVHLAKESGIPLEQINEMLSLLYKEEPYE